ncbi:hypothetical protein Aab01nite_61590 [Paractinoplanes abujensis]|uniref:Uncharacterized protein n=1 Tax=Paractinoplanes abujensis TaxID=882441 RepID=A0A7W7CT74_9ACTN|nr:hypothetical protein [Actinoplanes abujensis]MBB4692930.1 hypothetical protein [Actinoplanes abujensis]GID22569.1 hypothetical protein Aab01nite_61590 [Actinoplanes abujensis]
MRAPALRLWLGVLIGVQLLTGRDAGGEQMYVDAYAAVPFLCWLPNLVVAEFLIRRRNLPSPRFAAPAAGPRRA